MYYSTVDKLSVSKDNASAPIAELDSPYFKVKELASNNLMKFDGKAAFEYMDSTPMLVKLMKSGGGTIFLRVSRPYLFCQYGEWLYFIAHSIVGDSDVYQLRRISLR